MGIENGDPMSVGAPMTVQGWLSGGWDPETVVLTVKRVIARGHKARSLGYFERAIADAHAELTRPLPEGSTGPPQRTKRTYADITRELEEQIYGPKSDADPTAAAVIDG